MRDLVIHSPTGLVLDFAENDFGGTGQAAVVLDWRRRGKANQGEFICHIHQDREKPWLYLQQRSSRVIVAAHWPGSKLDGSHEIVHGVSDEHKRQVDYISRAGEAAGYEVEAEVSLPTKVRSDAVIYGPTTTGIEVQRSALAVAAAKARTTKARRAGVLPVWFSDASRDPAWMFKVPSVRMNEQSWNTVPHAGSVTVVSGVRIIVPRRCREIPADLNGCPKRRQGCNRWHATHAPKLGVTVDGMAALVPGGEMVPINYKTLTGKEYVFIVDRSDKQRYEAVSGAPADLPLKPKERLVRTGGRSTCVGDAGEVVVHTRPTINVVRTPMLDWRSYPTGTPMPCRLCGKPALMRDSDDRACHKVCAEDELARSQARLQ